MTAADFLPARDARGDEQSPFVADLQVLPRGVRELREAS